MAHYKGAASEAGRAMQLMKKREKAQQEIEYKRKKIEEDLKISNIENKFAAHYDAVEQQLKSSTIGLVTLDEMKAKQEDIVKQRERKLAQKQLEKEQEKQRQLEAKQAEKNKQKRQIQALSFTLQDDEEEEENEEEEEKIDIKPVIKKIKKNPDVDTSFLPDRDREEEENMLREELRQEWASQQARLKEEEIHITFSYWDGSGHRRTVKMKKGNSIYQFLQRCLELLRKEFSELKTVMADQLMYVKEDLILPHHYTFYDFIVTKARGKSGPLFTFDVHDDVRLTNDASIEKEDSHAGKVLLRSWYERNKHIFPASRWEPYDPTKSYDKYTVSDKGRNCKEGSHLTGSRKRIIDSLEELIIASVLSFGFGPVGQPFLAETSLHIVSQRFQKEEFLKARQLQVRKTLFLPLEAEGVTTSFALLPCLQTRGKEN